MQYLLGAVGLLVVLGVVVLVWLLTEHSLRRARSQSEDLHQDWVTRFERTRQERDEALGRSAERAERTEARGERAMVLRQEAVELARQMVQNQETIIALLQKLEERKG